MNDNILKIKAYLCDQVFIAKLVVATEFKMSGAINGKGPDDFVGNAIHDVLTGLRNPNEEDVLTERATYDYMLGVIKSLISNARTSKEGKTKHVQESSEHDRASNSNTEEEYIRNEEEQLAIQKVGKIRASLKGDVQCLVCMDHFLDVIDDNIYEVNKTLAKRMNLPVNEIIDFRKKINRAALKLGSV